MPKWGLTKEQRQRQPWGLDSKYLAPSKVITDPIHGDVFVTVLEQTFIDTEPFERLRRIKQLGNTHLVYPGATHSRFSHSLGAVRVAQDLIDAVIDQRYTPKPKPDLFAEWDRERETIFEGVAQQILDRAVTNDGQVEVQLTEQDFKNTISAVLRPDLRIAEAVVAVRLGALLHDLCHIPFGHSLEDELAILTPHDKNITRFDRMWERMNLPTELDDQMRNGGLYDEIRGLILSKVTPETALRYPFVKDIVGNTICADLLDYLERDHRELGLPVALGRRFVSAFYVMPSGDRDLQHHMILSIIRPDGRERTDVVTEVLKYLRYRYELSERALVHHAKLAADAMVGKALEMWHDVIWVEEALTHLRDRHVDGGKPAHTFRVPKWLGDRDVDKVRRKFDQDYGGEEQAAVRDQARLRLDDALSRRGDDALLESLAQFDSPTGHPRRAEGVRYLTRAVLDRRLFKQIGTQHRPPRGRERMAADWNDAERRRKAEEDAARWANLNHRWQVLLWVPPHEMRMKIADVLVDGGEAGIMRFAEYESQGRNRGSEIYEAHRALWSIGVYLDPEYQHDELVKMRVLARLAQRMNITFTQYERQLGKLAYLWPRRLAARAATNLADDDPEAADKQPRLVDELMKAVDLQVQARGNPDDETWDGLLARYRAVAEAERS